MYHISSAVTLALKVFLPTFWLTFFGMFMLVVNFDTDEAMFAGFPVLWFRIGITLFWLSGLILFYYTILKLKRIDADATHIFVSSYLKNIRYPIEDVEAIHLSKFGGILSMGTVELKGKGTFGKYQTFLPSTARLRRFKETYPQWEAKMQ